ncbi:MAG TPA: hypothetical protein VJH71_02515 [Candidatus Paceibacterota bacterium]
MKTSHVLLISFLISIILLFIIPKGFLPQDISQTILTVTTFLFGILAGFYILVTYSEYDTLKKSIGNELSGWHSLFEGVKRYRPEELNTFSDLLDSYVIRSFDPELIEYSRATQSEFEKIEKFISNMPLNKDLESVLEVEILTPLNVIREARDQLFVLGAKSLSGFQWLILYSLAAIFIVSLYNLRSDNLFFDTVVVLLSVSVALIFLLVRGLDDYTWNEKNFGISSFENLLLIIGKLPYYPKTLITSGRVRPIEKEYRVGVSYNSETGQRKIEIVKNNK